MVKRANLVNRQLLLELLYDRLDNDLEARAIILVKTAQG